MEKQAPTPPPVPPKKILPEALRRELLMGRIAEYAVNECC